MRFLWIIMVLQGVVWLYVYENYVIIIRNNV